MKRVKAEKHLGYAREHLQYLREDYVKTMRDPNWKRLEKLAELRKDMEETKLRIAKFERIVL